MGIVVRESIKSSIITYVGMAIGMVNVVFLYTKYLSPEELGLTRVLLDTTLLFVAFAQIGSPFIIIKYFPGYAGKQKDHRSFLSFILTYSLIGFLIFTIIFLLLQNSYLNFYSNKSPLLIQYFFYIMPLVLSTIYINTLEAYIIIHNKLVYPTFIREIFLRISNTIIIVLYAFQIIDFAGFINLLVASYFVAVLLLTLYINKLGILFLDTHRNFWKLNSIKPMIGYGLFTVLGGLGFILSSKIDTIMLPAYRGLTDTAIYSIAVLIATIMEVPKKTLIRAVLPNLSFAINKSDIVSVKDIYKKTSINLLIFGLMIFILVWMNIEDLFKIIPNGAIYIGGKSVLFFFLFSRLIDLVTGVNNEIILYSKYFRYNLLLILLFGALTVISNLIFIPLYGMIGAAFATTLSLIIFQFLESFIVWKKFHIHPFSMNTLKAIALFFLFWFLADILKQFLAGLSEDTSQVFLIGTLIIIKTTFLSVIFIYTFMKLRISEDFSNLILSIYFKLKGLIQNG